MFVNGTIYIGTVTSSYIDSSTGELVSQPASWDTGSPCAITTNSDTTRGIYDDGEFRQSSFNVLLEMPINHIEMEYVKLVRNGEDLGTFKVLSIQPFTTVGRVKIVV